MPKAVSIMSVARYEQYLTGSMEQADGEKDAAARLCMLTEEASAPEALAEAQKPIDRCVMS